MDPVDSGNRTSAPPGRPSLFGAGASPSPTPRQGDAVSILASLDKTGGRTALKSRTGLPNWFTIAVGSLLGITIAVAIVMSLTKDAGIGQRAPKQLPGAAGSVSEKPLVATPVIQPQPQEAAVPAPQIVAAAATIENAPPAAATPVATPSEQKSPASIPATAPAGKAANPPEAVPDRASGSSGNVKPAAAQSPAPVTVQADAKPEKPVAASKKPAAANRDTKPEHRAPPADPADRDASLLAALAAYGEGRPAKDISAQAEPTAGKPAAASPAKAQPTLAQAGSGQFDPKRDVVTRESSVSTGELVRRCKTLGFFEGMLCRIRVCSNQWGKDPACPQSSAPAQGTN